MQIFDPLLYLLLHTAYQKEKNNKMESFLNSKKKENYYFKKLYKFIFNCNYKNAICRNMQIRTLSEITILIGH